MATLYLDRKGAALDIGLLLLSGRRNEATARLVGRPHDDVALRLAQYRRASDTEASRETARFIIGAKLAGKTHLLGRALEMRPDRRKPLTDALDTLSRLQARIAGEAERLDRDTLTGFEGAGAAAYFRAYATLLPQSLEFSRRRRRPPPDPVNVGLSLGYTLLHHVAVREPQIVGLDPLIGFLHVAERGRESLRSDLVEPMRPHVDEWVWRSFAERLLRGEHFSREKGGACSPGAPSPYRQAVPAAASRQRLRHRARRRLRSPAPSASTRSASPTSSCRCCTG